MAQEITGKDDPSFHGPEPSGRYGDAMLRSLVSMYFPACLPAFEEHDRLLEKVVADFYARTDAARSKLKPTENDPAPELAAVAKATMDTIKAWEKTQEVTRFCDDLEGRMRVEVTRLKPDMARLRKGSICERPTAR